MKKIIQAVLSAAFLFMITFANPVNAQDNKKEMEKIAKNYEEAYNKKDLKAIKGFYTKDAVRINTDGTTTNGSEAIGADLTDFFASNSPTITIMVNDCTTQSDGTVVTTGTYSGSAGGSDFKGSYTNTSVKEDGQWKISKSVLTNQ